MVRKLAEKTLCPEDFTLTEKTLERMARQYPTVDIERTLEKFVLNAESKGWVYANWQMAFINYVDNADKYGGVYFKQGKVQDPAWIRVLREANQYGFRGPLPHETPSIYETQFNLWRTAPKTQRDMSVVSELFKAR